MSDTRCIAANFAENMEKILHQTGLDGDNARQRRYHRVVLELAALNLKKAEQQFQLLLRPQHLIQKRHQLEAELEQMGRTFAAMDKTLDFETLGQMPLDLCEVMNWMRLKYKSFPWFKSAYRFFLKWECAMKGVEATHLDEADELPPILGTIVPRWAQPQTENEEDLAFKVQIVR